VSLLLLQVSKILLALFGRFNSRKLTGIRQEHHLGYLLKMENARDKRSSLIVLVFSDKEE